MNKKEELIKKVEGFDNKYFNQDQKNIITNILRFAPEEQIQEYFDFIIMKKRVGFNFDASPEIAKGRIIDLKKNSKLSINGSKDIEHKLLIGENYNALKALALTHKGAIDIIYIDPPYNTESAKKDGNDSSKEGEGLKFVYKDKYGRNGWLNMMSERLKLASRLLSKEGTIFVSIDDSEQAYLKIIMDDIFGEHAFVSCVPRLSSPQRSGQEKFMNVSHDYILIYSFGSDFNNIIDRDIDVEKVLEDKNGKYIKGDTKAILAAKSQGYSKGGDYDFEYNGKIYKPEDSKGNRNRWLWTKERMQAAADLGILVETKSTLRMQLYIDKKFEEKTNMMVDKELGKLTLHTSDFMNSEYSNPKGVFDLEKVVEEKELFPFPKPVSLIKKLISLVENNKDAIVLDFFAGSGTTAQAVLELNKEDGGNRQFILSTNNENPIDKITKEKVYKTGIGYDVTMRRISNFIDKELKDDGISVDLIDIGDSTIIDLDQNLDMSILDKKDSELRLLNPKYNKKGLSLYYDLAALNPLEEE